MKNEAVSSKVYANSGNPEVLRHLPESPCMILDVGCGSGDNARALVDSGHTIDGITLSKNEAIQARRYCREVFCFNLEDGLPAGVLHRRYDCVVCSHVLEHICFPETLLSGINAVLAAEGRLIVALPNLMHIRNRWNLLRGRFEYTQNGLMDNTHFRWYTFASSEKLLREHGFHLLEHYVTGYMPMGRVRRLLPKFCRKLDGLLCRIWPGLFGYQIVLVGEKL